MKSALAVLFATVLSMGLTMTTPSPVNADDQTGLVNVAIGDISTGDILSNNTVTVGVAANIAANVCNIPVQAGLLSLQLQRSGNFRCENNQTLKFAQVTK